MLWWFLLAAAALGIVSLFIKRKSYKSADLEDDR